MQGSGPEGVNDLCFHTYEEFSPLERGGEGEDLEERGRGGEGEGGGGEGGKNSPYV